MWQISTGRDFLQQSGQVVTSGVIDGLLADLPETEGAARAGRFAFETEWFDAQRGSIPGFTALETYADDAVESYEGEGALRTVGPAVQWRPGGARLPSLGRVP